MKAFTIASIIAVTLMISHSVASAADDAAALYKAKCANCHGATGEGKSAMKAPPLKGISMSAEQIEQFLQQGESGKKAPHGKAISGLNADQAKMVAEYVKTLQ